MDSLAPILLFIYNRPNHLQRCLESLSKNSEIENSELFIFADGPKKNANKVQLENIRLTRSIAVEKKWAGIVHLIFRDENLGLSESIIQGVSQVIKIHGKVIVLEDDLIIGTFFLKYMNEALDKYQNMDDIAQISGFLHPINTYKNNGTFLMPIYITIGWGTWKRVWDNIDFYPTDYHILSKEKGLRKRFDLDGNYPYTKMLFNQMKTPNYDSWGIRFCWQNFKDNKLTVFPDYTLVQHCDKELAGTHKSNYDFLDQKNWNESYKINSFTDEILVNFYYFKKIKFFIGFNNGIFGKIKRYSIAPMSIIKRFSSK